MVLKFECASVGRFVGEGASVGEVGVLCPGDRLWVEDGQCGHKSGEGAGRGTPMECARVDNPIFQTEKYIIQQRPSGL